MLISLARLSELFILQNMEAASRFGRVRGTAWSHLARDGGDLQSVMDGFVKTDIGRLRRCVNDQLAEFPDREKAYEADETSKRAARSRYARKKTSRSRQMQGGSRVQTNRRRCDRCRSSNANRYESPPKKDETGKKEKSDVKREPETDFVGTKEPGKRCFCL